LPDVEDIGEYEMCRATLNSETPANLHILNLNQWYSKTYSKRQ